MKTTLRRFAISYNKANDIHRNQYKDYWDEMFFHSSLYIIYMSQTVKDKIMDVFAEPIDI